jgi:hypothetical protein
VASSEVVIQLLDSINKNIERLVALAEANQPEEVASDSDLDGQYGNPEIKAKDPRDWTGEPMAGRRMSECPVAYLDMIAERSAYFAQQETDPKKAKYKRLDAARARGWAKRIRDGKHTPAPVAQTADSGRW